MRTRNLVFEFGSFGSEKRLAQFHAEAAEASAPSPPKGTVLQLVPVGGNVRKPNRRSKEARKDRRIRYYRGSRPKHARRA